MLQVYGFGTERTVTSQDNDALAEECLSLWIGETLQGGLIAVIRAQNLGGGREIYLVLGIRTEIAILIYYIYFYEGCRGRMGIANPQERLMQGCSDRSSSRRDDEEDRQS